MSVQKVKINKSHSLPLAEPLLIKFFGDIKIFEYQNGNIYQKLNSESSIKLKVLEGTSIKTLKDGSIAVLYDNIDFTLNSKRKCLKCNKEINLLDFEKGLENEEDDRFKHKITEIKGIWLNPESEILCSICSPIIYKELSKEINIRLKVLMKDKIKLFESFTNLLNLCNKKIITKLYIK
jgi:hypothetical protein